MIKRGKTEKVSVTLPTELAGEIRSIVQRGEVSLFFTQALEHYLAHRKQHLALEKGFGAWKDINHSDLASSRDSTTYVRNLREADQKRSQRLGGKGAK